MRAQANVGRWKGEAAVVLQASDVTATFLPERGMLGVSLTHRGDEMLAMPNSVRDWNHGATTGMPLLHPWANRLASRSYRAAGRTVRLHGVDLPVDEHGRPIHGTVRATPFAIEQLVSRDTIASLRTRLHSPDDPLLTRAFPYPHDLVVTVRLAPNVLRVTTELSSTGDTVVPVSFGWHPYFRLPGAPRRSWSLRMPARREIELGSDFVPTGRGRRVDAETAPIGSRTFDHHYALGKDRRFTVANASHSLTMTFDEGYPYAQIYAPPRREFVCVEPMTAPVGALVRGRTGITKPGDTYRAGFAIAIAAR